MGMYRIRTVLTGNQGSPWLNTMYFDDGGGSAQQAADAAGLFWAECQDGMKTTIHWETEADVATIDEATGNTTAVTLTTPVDGDGVDSGNILPWATQGLVRFRTGVYLAGREIRGRAFIPGTTETFTATGLPDSSLTAYMQNAVTAVLGAANATLVVWSRKNQVSAVVSSGSPWNNYATLRSRRD